MKMLINVNNSEEDTVVYMMESHGYSFCMLSYCEAESHIMYLSNLNVKECMRRMRYGNEMLNYAIKYARGHGCRYLYLYVVDGDSWISNWYKEKGFIPLKKGSDGGCNMFLEIKKK